MLRQSVIIYIVTNRQWLASNAYIYSILRSVFQLKIIMQTVDKVTVFLAELIGTGMLLFFGCAGCITWGGPANHFQIVINFGLAVMAAVQIFGCISGAHLNPSVTVAALIFKKVDFTTACIYVTAQLLGSFMGFGLLKVLTPDNVFGSVTIVNGTEIETENALCLTMPHSSLSALQAVVLEFVATSVLILTCCACAWDSRNANHHDSLSLRFGLTIASIAYSVVSESFRSM